MDRNFPGTLATIRVDPVEERLWRGDEAVALRPKTWAVLCYLLERPDVLVTKTELLDALWPGTAVAEGILNKSITELRAAIGDDRNRPRFIETIARRGFRWIGGASVLTAPAAAATVSPAALETPLHLVGRDGEMATLDKCLARAAAGVRQVVFVTGEAGAGKSTLVDAFLAGIEKDGSALSAWGQCIESFGQHEPYRPFLEAFERLARHREGGPAIVAALRTHAPTWLRQIPSLGEEAVPLPADASVTPARMLREIATVFEEFSRQRPLVLVLEDVHWADLATIDACNLLARRRDPARLLLVLTMRAADALVSQHPALTARTELTSRGLAVDVLLEPFTPEVLQDYLGRRCGGLDLDPELSWWIHHQTAGNPLFVRIVVDELIERGILAAGEDGLWRPQGSPRELRDFVPDSLRELVERQLDRLSPAERRLAEAGSVLRTEFAASTAATLAGLSEEEAEEVCRSLARRGQILRPAGRAGSSSGLFAFVHSMVQRVLHDRIPTMRLRRLHLAAAEQLEREHPEGSDALAVQLALHYAMAEDPAAAILHLQRAAASVQRIPAPRDVIVIREQILDLVERNPDLPDHRRRRLVATMDLAEARQLAAAVVDAETNALCERVLSLAVAAEDGREAFLASMGIFSNRFYTGRYREAEEIGRRLLAVAELRQHPFMLKSAEFAVACTTYRLGDFAEAAAHFESCLRHSARSQETYGWDFHSMSLSHLALLSVHTGRPGDARRLVEEAGRGGHRADGSPDAAVLPMLAYALTMLRDDDAALALVERSLSLADRIGAAAWIERARFLRGLLLSRQGRSEDGVQKMKESLARQARQPVHLDRTAYCCLLADEMLRRKMPGAGAFVEEGLACLERSNERHFEPELHRLRGELRIANGASDEDATAAESDFRHAVAVARARGARWNELVSATSLARLLHRRGRPEDARKALRGACDGFGKEDGMVEVSEARELLAALGGS